MKAYIDLGKHVLNTGNYRGDRTGTDINLCKILILKN